MQGRPRELDKGPDEVGVAFAPASRRQAGDRCMDGRPLESFIEPLRVHVAPEGEGPEVRERDQGDRAGLVLPGESRQGQGRKGGEAGHEVRDVREVDELAIGEGEGGHGGMGERASAGEALEVGVCEGEGGEARATGEDRREGGLDGLWLFGCLVRRSRRDNDMGGLRGREVVDVKAELGRAVQQPPECRSGVGRVEAGGAKEVESGCWSPCVEGRRTCSQSLGIVMEEVDDIVG